MDPEPAPRPFPSGVRRWRCDACGSPLAAEFPYLPNQIYVPLGLLDQADVLVPELHAHAEQRVPWLHVDAGQTEIEGSSRATLLATGAPE